MIDTVANKTPLTESVAQFANALGITKWAAYEAIKRGEVPVLRFGRTFRIPVAARERIIAKALQSVAE